MAQLTNKYGKGNCLVSLFQCSFPNIQLLQAAMAASVHAFANLQFFILFAYIYISTGATRLATIQLTTISEIFCTTNVLL